MELRDAVAKAAQAQSEHGHGERLALVRGVGASEAEKCLLVEAHRRCVFAQVTHDEVGRKEVDAGGDRSVRGEHGGGGNGLAGFGEGYAAFLHQHPDPFQPEECGVTLVHVAGDGREAQRFQGAHAADAKDDLLLDAHLGVAAVEAGGELAVSRNVRLDIRVEEVEGDFSNVKAPDFGRGGPAIQRHVDAEALAVAAMDGLQRLEGRVHLTVVLLLPAIRPEALVEIAAVVEQADADQGDAEVRSGLQVVAGKDAETT